MRLAYVVGCFVLATAGACTPFGADSSTSSSGAGSSSSSGGTGDGGGASFACTGGELYCQTFDGVATVDDLTSGPAATSGQTEDMSLTASQGESARALRIVPAATPAYYESRIVYEQTTVPTKAFTMRFDLSVGSGSGYEVGSIELVPTKGDTSFVKLTVDAGRKLTAHPYGGSDTSLGTLQSGAHTISLTIDPASGKATATVDGIVKPLGAIAIPSPTSLKLFHVLYGLVGNDTSAAGEFVFDNLVLTAQP